MYFAIKILHFLYSLIIFTYDLLTNTILVCIVAYVFLWLFFLIPRFISLNIRGNSLRTRRFLIFPPNDTAFGGVASRAILNDNSVVDCNHYSEEECTRNHSSMSAKNTLDTPSIISC